MDRVQFERVSRPYGNNTCTEVYVTPGAPFRDWELYGTWAEEDLAPVENALIELEATTPGKRPWRLYHRDTKEVEEMIGLHRFVARRAIWQSGPFIYAETTEELIERLRRYYTTGK